LHIVQQMYQQQQQMAATGMQGNMGQGNVPYGVQQRQTQQQQQAAYYGAAGQQAYGRR
jgi:hypothetical protein